MDISMSAFSSKCTTAPFQKAGDTHADLSTSNTCVYLFYNILKILFESTLLNVFYATCASCDTMNRRREWIACESTNILHSRDNRDTTSNM